MCVHVRRSYCSTLSLSVYCPPCFLLLQPITDAFIYQQPFLARDLRGLKISAVQQCNLPDMKGIVDVCEMPSMPILPIFMLQHSVFCFKCSNELERKF